MAGQSLVGRLQQMRAAFLNAVADAPIAPRHLVHHPGQHRCQHQDGQRDLPAMPQHQRQRADHLQRLLDHHLDRIHRRLRHLVRVRAQPDQHRRYRFGVKARPRQAQILGHHLDAQVARDAARGFAHRHIGDVAGDPAHHEQQDDLHRQPATDFGILVDEGLVGDRLHQCQEAGRARRLDQRSNQRGDQQQAIRLGEGQQATVRAPGRNWRRAVVGDCHWRVPLVRVWPVVGVAPA